MKYYKLSSKCLATSSQCRMDAKYNIFCSNDKRRVFKDYPKHILLSEILEPMAVTKYKKGELDEEMYLINISDQQPGYGELEYGNIIKVSEINSDKTDLTESDIIVSKLGMSRAYIFVTPLLDAKIIGSSEYIPYKFKKTKHAVFYKHLLLNEELRHAYECLETGKTPSHKRVNPEEFLKIEIPEIDDYLIGPIINQILKIEEEIDDIKEGIRKIDEIVNEKFSEFFGYDLQLVHSVRKGMTYGTQSSCNTSLSVFFTELDRITDKKLRFSARSKNPVFEELKTVVHNIGSIPLGSVLKEIHNGSSPKYDKNGEVPVVKTAHVSNSGLVDEFEEFVSEELYNKYPNAQIRKYDVLLCNIGKCSLGKVCLNLKDDKMFAATETMILRVDANKYNPFFLTFFLQSILGYSQSEQEYTGTTNQIHISPDSISQFYIPDIDIKKQEQIVEGILEKLEEERDKMELIYSKRREISNLILHVCLCE